MERIHYFFNSRADDVWVSFLLLLVSLFGILGLAISYLHSFFVLFELGVGGFSLVFCDIHIYTRVLKFL